MGALLRVTGVATVDHVFRHARLVGVNGGFHIQCDRNAFEVRSLQPIRAGDAAA